MSFEKIMSMASRLFFLVAFVLLGLGVIERIANQAGYTVAHYAPSRLLEIAVILLIFVIAIQLRAIRLELRKN
jgi:hypothetical protein